MNWLKNAWGGISAVFLFALTLFAIASARSHKLKAERWQDAAVDAELDNVIKGTGAAKAALGQAKLANARAGEKKTKAKERLDAIGKKDPELASVLNSWKSTRIK